MQNEIQFTVNSCFRTLLISLFDNFQLIFSFIAYSKVLKPFRLKRMLLYRPGNPLSFVMKEMRSLTRTPKSPNFHSLLPAGIFKVKFLFESRMNHFYLTVNEVAKSLRHMLFYYRLYRSGRYQKCAGQLTGSCYLIQVKQN